MKDKKIIDAFGNEVQDNENLFKLCQENIKIADKKFDSKPTTFAKDALKRFRKNKSSVIASYILFAILFCAFVVPFFLPANISVPQPSEGFLAPKLFDAGTGFWDGTKKISKHPYDTINEKPAGNYSDDAISNIRVSNEGEYFINNYNESAYGGYYVLTNNDLLDEGDNLDDKGTSTMLYTRSTYYDSSNTEIVLTTEDIQVDYDDYERVIGMYRIFLNYIDPDDSTKTIKLNVTDWSDEYGEKVVNISDFLLEQNIFSLEKATVGVELLPKVEARTILPIKSILIKNNGNISKLSMADPNYTLGLQKNIDGTFPEGYWQCNGEAKLYKANIIYCWFTYDTYKAVYGTFIDESKGSSDINKYIANGWCEYDFDIGPSSFKSTSKKCPVVSVVRQEEIKSAPGRYKMVLEMSRYRLLGYENPPRFLFGTDSNGYDIVKLSFVGLRISCFLAIAVSAICFAFGLIWGAISGYFGGNIDLAMERFCDILGGVPWLVVMTLAKLHFGSNLGTLAIALCVTGWMGIAGRTRTQFYRFKGREYVLASRTLGASDSRLIFKHILPNSLGTIVTSSILMIPSVIFSESVLAYLGIFRGTTSFGSILAKNQIYLNSSPNLIVFPSVIIALLMISFNLFGNGLRDALNPSLKGSD